MTISAKIIADSISEAGKRITTMQLRYPRFVHAEFMTHRVFSRNASSSRAVPVNKLIEDIIADTAMPIHWGKNQPGMQADEEHDIGIINCAKDLWNNARDEAIETARVLIDLNFHKQIVNRLLEPFSHINVLVTATEWDNFYALRRHKDAQPEIHALADCMHHAMKNSVPQLKIVNPYGSQWHVPYVDKESEAEIFNYEIPGAFGPADLERAQETCIKCSVARCARVSYLTHDMKRPTIESDLKLYDRLVGSVPLHASPAEHQATPDPLKDNDGRHRAVKPGEWGNFSGWRQWRKMIEI